jgi:hypothetical protein
MIIAIVMLTASLVLIAAVATSAVHVNNTTTQTKASGQALAAANAGAQVALFKLDAGGVATGTTGSMGNGATYKYAITTLGPTGSTGVTGCTGLSVQNSSLAIQQDCITSVGSVNGVNAQVQTRVVGYTPQLTLFPVAGVFAETGFYTTQLNGTFSLGSNGTLSLTNANLSQVRGDIEYLTGNLNQSQNSGEMCTGTCTPEVLASAIPAPTIANSAYANAATTNSDASIVLTNATLSSNVITALSDSPAASAAFAPGIYYLCGINVGGYNSFSITTSGSGLVQIYIDSPNRPGSTCAAGTGNIYNAGNATGAINSAGVASNLQLYFYGQPGCTHATPCPELVEPPNGMTVRADIFAPDSEIDPGGAFAMTGALTINYVNANNNFSFTYQAPSAAGAGGGAFADFFPARQTTCTPSSTPTTKSC